MLNKKRLSYDSFFFVQHAEQISYVIIQKKTSGSNLSRFKESFTESSQFNQE